MAARNSRRVRENLGRIIGRISGPQAERAVTEALIIGGGMAATMTPVDTSLLINSQFRIVRQVNGGVQGKMGYSAAYAAAVHDASGKLDGQPRDPNDGSRGNFWDPDAEPEFLTKGFEDSKSAIDAAVKRTMRI